MEKVEYVKTLTKKKLVLAGGDFLLIIAAFYLSYAIRYGVYKCNLSWFRWFGFIAIYIPFSFYIAEVYNFEGKLYRISYLVRLAIAIVIANSLIAFILYFFDPFRGSRIVFVLNYFIIFFFCFSGDTF